MTTFARGSSSSRFPRVAPAHALALIAALACLAGCAGSSTKSGTALTDVWRNKAYQGPFEQALIIGLARSEEIREEFEGKLVWEFKRKGQAALASYEVLPDQEKVDEETVRASIEGRGIDVVLVARLLGTSTETERVSGPSYDTPEFDDFYGFYFYTQTNIRNAPDYRDYDVVQVETKIWEVSNQRLIWTGLSELFDPKNTKETISKVSREILTSLQAEGWLG